MDSQWSPTTPAERAMQDALQRNDSDQYFQYLSEIELYLPTTEVAPAGSENIGWATWVGDGRTHLLAFTSVESLRRCLGEHAGQFRTFTLPDLATVWPDPQWWLAINPGLPVEAYLPAWFVEQLATGRPTPADEEPGKAGPPADLVQRGESVAIEDLEPLSDPEEESASVRNLAARAQRSTERSKSRRKSAEVPPQFQPANELEVALLKAAAAGDTDTFIKTLVVARVLIPQPQRSLRGSAVALEPSDPSFRWHPVDVDGQTSIAMFTSPERLVEQLGAEMPYVETSYLALISAWPDKEWSMALNAHTPVGATLPGEQVVVLAKWAAQLGLGRSADPINLDDLQDAARASDAAALKPDPDIAQSADSAAEADALRAETLNPYIEPAQADAELGESGSASDSNDSVSEGPADIADEAEGLAATAEAARPTVMQKILPPEHVSYYLERGYDRVGGFVYRAQDVLHLDTPEKLYQALGLDHPDLPFSSDDDSVHIVRWTAYRADLYRIPYGAQSESELRDGDWVVERAPFRGNGFTAGADELIPEYKVDSIRLPHGAEMYRLDAEGKEEFVAGFDGDRRRWLRAVTPAPEPTEATEGDR